jgi:hypothetical protein
MHRQGSLSGTLTDITQTDKKPATLGEIIEGKQPFDFHETQKQGVPLCVTLSISSA